MNSDTYSIQLALKHDLPIPVEAFHEWAGRTKIFEWAKHEGLQLCEANGSRFIYEDEFAAFVKRKYHLRAVPPLGAASSACYDRMFDAWTASDPQSTATLMIATHSDLPLPIRYFNCWSGRSKLFEWRITDAMPLYDINGHSCAYPDEFAACFKQKFGLRSGLSTNESAANAA